MPLVRRTTEAGLAGITVMAQSVGLNFTRMETESPADVMAENTQSAVVQDPAVIPCRGSPPTRMPLCGCGAANRAAPREKPKRNPSMEIVMRVAPACRVTGAEAAARCEDAVQAAAVKRTRIRCFLMRIPDMFRPHHQRSPDHGSCDAFISLPEREEKEAAKERGVFDFQGWIATILVRRAWYSQALNT